MDELVDDFIAETRETLEALTSELISWEAAPNDRALLDSVFRFFHTMKGSCGFLDLPRFARLSHAAEDLLGAVREGRLSATPALVDAVLAVIDRIAELTDALEKGAGVDGDDGPLIRSLEALLAGDVPAAPGPVENRAEPEVQESEAQRLRTVRVQLSVLDRLMVGMSDLVLARNELARHLRGRQLTGEVEQSFERLSGRIADVRDLIGLMRMQRIDRLFSAVPRLVRDLSHELGKQVELSVEGGDVEIDREMIEAIRDPLTHMIRNAIDHGLESPAARAAAGKPAAGQLRLSARQASNQILIEIEDDGRGIDLGRLTDRAVERGLIGVDEARRLKSAEALDLIFAPGLSTASGVSAVSGRGVGMDVVRTNIAALGGTIELDNRPGEGLRVSLRLPLTLSIIAALTLTAGGQMFALAQSSVIEILRRDNPNLRLDSSAGAEVATVRGRRMPHARLERVLGLSDSGEDGPDRCVIIVRPAVGGSFALSVASVLDHEELVVKPGAPLVMATGLYTGMSLPDSGRPLLLLDPGGIAAAVGTGDAGSRPSRTATPRAERRGAAVLLFRQLDGCPRALRLAVVQRMIEVPAEDIAHRGGAAHLAADGVLVPVLGMDQPPATPTVKLLRLSDGTTSLCLAIDDVIDMLELDRPVTPTADPTLEGVTLLAGQQVELIDPFFLFASVGTGETAPGAVRRCVLAPSLDDGWGREVLAPLLARAGYEVSFEPASDGARHLVIASACDDLPGALRLRPSRLAGAGEADSIWRHDRAGLLAAIAAATGEAA